MNLRYYTSEASDFYLKDLFYIANLLNKINEEVCPVEVIFNKSEEDIWKNDMLPQTRVIKKNTRQSATEWLKARSGNLHVYGTLAVVENGAVQWITKYGKVKKTLENILDQGEKGIEDLFEEIKEKPTDENAVLNNFIRSGLISGSMKREVEVGIKSVENKHKVGEYSYEQYEFAKNIIVKKIDIIIESENEIWLIEGKSRFDSKKAEEALGQVLIYEELYGIDYKPAKNLRKAVVFGTPLNIGIIGIGEGFLECWEV